MELYQNLLLSLMYRIDLMWRVTLKKNEEQTMHYLNSYSDILEQCEKKKEGQKKDFVT